MFAWAMLRMRAERERARWLENREKQREGEKGWGRERKPEDVDEKTITKVITVISELWMLSHCTEREKSLN